MFRAYLGVLDKVLIPLIIRIDTGHRNSEIYQALQLGVLQYRLVGHVWVDILHKHDTINESCNALTLGSHAFYCFDD